VKGDGVHRHRLYAGERLPHWGLCWGKPKLSLNVNHHHPNFIAQQSLRRRRTAYAKTCGLISRGTANLAFPLSSLSLSQQQPPGCRGLTYASLTLKKLNRANFVESQLTISLEMTMCRVGGYLSKPRARYASTREDPNSP